MDLFIYFAFAIIGLLLGLIGAGGSIFTLPILVYLMGIEINIATIYSLFIVAFTSFLALISYVRKKMVHWKVAVLFAIPSLFAIFFTKKYILPHLPTHIFLSSTFSIKRSSYLLFLFALLMMYSSVKMIRQNKNIPMRNSQLYYGHVLIQGVLIGFLTAMFGAGGGFLMIPILLTTFQFPIRLAIGTSLASIFINSFSGFLLSKGYQIVDWNLLWKILFFTSLGGFIGSYFSNKAKVSLLKKIFGWFVLITGASIFLQQFFLLLI